MTRDRQTADPPLERWLIIADSLALPRPGVAYEHTWPSLLGKAMPQLDLICRAMRSATTERLQTEGEHGADCLEFYAPDGVILQLGICDCAPRLLPRKSLITQLIYRLPFGLNRLVSNCIESCGGRREGNAWVSQIQFEENLDHYLMRARGLGVAVVALCIFPVTQSLLVKNPSLNQQIIKYNQIYHKLSERHANLFLLHVFEPGEDVEAYFIDGYHLNEVGGRRVAAALEALLAGPIHSGGSDATSPFSLVNKRAQ